MRGEFRLWFTLFEAKTFWRLLCRNMCMSLSGGSFADFFYCTFNGLLIVWVKCDKEHFQKLIVKLNSFYEDYVVSEVLEKREIFFFNKKYMFSNKKQSSTVSFTLFTILKTIHFFYLTADWFSRNFQKTFS